MRTIYMADYDLNTKPAIPVVKELTLSQVGGSWTTTATAIVDSGADASAVPYKLVEPILWTSPTKFLEVKGITEIRYFRATTILLRCQINGFEVKTDWVVLGNEVVIGRDILNQLKIVLDGPPLDGGNVPKLTMYAR